MDDQKGYYCKGTESSKLELKKINTKETRLSTPESVRDKYFKQMPMSFTLKK